MEDGPRDGAGARTHETRQSDGGGCPPRKVSSTPLMTVRPAGADVKDVGLGHTAVAFTERHHNAAPAPSTAMRADAAGWGVETSTVVAPRTCGGRNRRLGRAGASILEIPADRAPHSAIPPDGRYARTPGS